MHQITYKVRVTEESSDRCCAEIITDNGDIFLCEFGKDNFVAVNKLMAALKKFHPEIKINLVVE